MAVSEEGIGWSGEWLGVGGGQVEIYSSRRDKRILGLGLLSLKIN